MINLNDRGFPVSNGIDALGDCRSIQLVCADKGNFLISLVEAKELWEKVSDSVHASWLVTKDSDYVWACIQEYLLYNNEVGEK